MELPALAGRALRRAGADGRQRRPAQARLERAADARSYLEELFRRAGFPEGCFQTLLIGVGRRSSACCATRGSRRRRSPAASRRAGRSRRSPGDEIKKTVLELGGSDPFVVLPSADLDEAAEVAVTARVPEQRPVLHRRQALHRARPTSTTRSPSASSSGWRRCGSATRSTPSTDVGPLATEQGRADVEELVDDAVDHGARPCCAAARASTAPAGSTRRPSSPASRRRCGCTSEEMFGPVAHALPGRRHRRGDRAGQRHLVRPRLERVDQRPRRAGALRARPRRRRGVRQRHDHVVPRSCRSAGSSARATAGSWRPSASGSSATPRRSGSATRPPSVFVRTRSC